MDGRYYGWILPGVKLQPARVNGMSRADASLDSGIDRLVVDIVLLATLVVRFATLPFYLSNKLRYGAPRSHIYVCGRSALAGRSPTVFPGLGVREVQQAPPLGELARLRQFQRRSCGARDARDDRRPDATGDANTQWSVQGGKVCGFNGLVWRQLYSCCRQCALPHRARVLSPVP